MTNTAILNRSGVGALTPPDTIDAVLFDFSGTVLDDGFGHHAIGAAARAMNERWGIDPAVATSDIRRAFAAVASEMADQPFYLMRDVHCAAFERVVRAHGHHASAGELVVLNHVMWSVAIPTAVAATGAVETIRALRAADIRTGIVSYADIDVFDGLLGQIGLAGMTDFEVCSEMARSCKPHPAIFRMALDAIDVSPKRAMFVGDSVEHDIVGANRLGMRTALLAGREFAIGGKSNDEPITLPNHHIDHLFDVLDLLRIRRAEPGVIC